MLGMSWRRKVKMALLKVSHDENSFAPLRETILFHVYFLRSNPIASFEEPCDCFHNESTTISSEQSLNIFHDKPGRSHRSDNFDKIPQQCISGVSPIPCTR